MVCKSCGAFLSDDLKECPVCGSLIEVSESSSQTNDNVTVEHIDQSFQSDFDVTDTNDVMDSNPKEDINENDASDESVESLSDDASSGIESDSRKDGIYIDQMLDTNQPVTSKKMSTSSIIAIVLAVLLAISAAFCAVLIIGKNEESPLNNIYKKVTGFFNTVFSDNKVKEYGADEVVAVFGDHVLTNAQLSIYYYDLIYYYYSYFGNYYFDPSTSLFEQDFSETQSWGDYFVTEAIESWKFAVALCDIAKTSSAMLPEDVISMINNIEKTLEDSAKAQGFGSADEYLKQQFGSFVTMEDYIEYFNDYCNSEYYYSEQYERKYRDYIDDDIDTLEKYNASVRHILISPEIENDETSLAEAKTKAEAILQEWLDMGQTEENFATLAQKYTDDTASASIGGLCEDFPSGKMVESFDQWSFDSTRKYGDYSIVESEWGYHIMFFITRTNPNASTKAQEELTAWIEEYMNSYSFTKHSDKVNIKLAQVYSAK